MMIEYKPTFRVSQFHLRLHVLNEKLNEFITQRSADLPVHSDIDDNVMLVTFQYTRVGYMKMHERPFVSHNFSRGL